MKIPLTFFSFSILLFSSGCVTKPLTRTDPLRLESKDLEFLNYCGYGIIPETHTDNFNTIPGIIAVTDTELIVAPGNSRMVDKNEVTKIPIAKIDGIAQIGRQLQIQHNDQLLVVFVYGMYPFEVDYQRDEKLYTLLRSKEIPEFKSTIVYNNKRTRGSENFWDAGPPTADESNADYNRQYPYTSQDGSVYNSGDTLSFDSLSIVRGPKKMTWEDCQRRWDVREGQ